MRQSELQRYRQMLLEMRERFDAHISRITEAVIAEEQPLGEHDHHVSQSADKEIALDLVEEDMRGHVVAALAKMDDGTYGLCSDCGKRIAKIRLNALPHTPFCVDCERKREA